MRAALGNPSRSVEDNIIMTARHGGISILITSATDALAFLVGACGFYRFAVSLFRCPLPAVLLPAARCSAVPLFRCFVARCPLSSTAIQHGHWRQLLTNSTLD